MNKMITASIMCADPLNMKKDLDFLAEKGIGYFHCDVMDGHFVPNLMLSTEVVNAVKKQYDIPLDLHLMVTNPVELLSWYPFGEGDIVSVHAESTPHLNRVLNMIAEKNAKPFIALNPATPLYLVEEVADDIAGVLLMTVNPGFAGQKMVRNAISRLTHLRQMLTDLGHPDMPIEVDGNCSLVNIPKLKAAGADLLVLGTSSLFDRSNGLEEGYRRSMAALAGGEKRNL